MDDRDPGSQSPSLVARSASRSVKNPAGESRRILYVVNIGWFFLSHRLSLAIAAKNEGFDVHVACGIDHPDEEEAIRRNGLKFHRLSLSRASRSPIGEARVILEMLQLFRRLRPSVIHLVSIKPVIYGGVLARFSSNAKIVSAISGLGYVFSASGLAWGVARAAIRLAYRVALGGMSTNVIFQNRDDMASFVEAGIIPARKARLIRGSGVDLSEFTAVPEPVGLPKVVLAARMLRDKGVLDFIEAARLLRQEGVACRFVLVGGIDRDNPAALSAADLAAAAGSAGVDWIGHTSDMAGEFQSAHIVCLPSYREGLPKSLLEAAASGRPMVATDVPGCREVVVDGVTGFLVPPQSPAALVVALRILIEDKALRQRFGKNARALCEKEFGIESVVAETLTLYGE